MYKIVMYFLDNPLLFILVVTVIIAISCIFYAAFISNPFSYPRPIVIQLDISRKRNVDYDNYIYEWSKTAEYEEALQMYKSVIQSWDQESRGYVEHAIFGKQRLDDIYQSMKSNIITLEYKIFMFEFVRKRTKYKQVSGVKYAYESYDTDNLIEYNLNNMRVLNPDKYDVIMDTSKSINKRRAENNNVESIRTNESNLIKLVRETSRLHKHMFVIKHRIEAERLNYPMLCKFYADCEATTVLKSLNTMRNYNHKKEIKSKLMMNKILLEEILTFNIFVQDQWALKNKCSYMNEKEISKIALERNISVDFKEYRSIEKTLYDSLKSDIMSMLRVTVNVSYTSAAGKNTYRNDRVFTYKELIQCADEVIDALMKPKRRKRTVSVKQRDRILRRDGYICQKCGAHGPGAGGNAVLHVDHKIPFSLGGSDDDSNLWVLCEACNLGKSNDYCD